MADPKPMEDESKKDTVRINLPAGGPGRPATPMPPGPSTQKLRPEGDAKRDTAVMGTPAPAAKRDTSRVQVNAAKQDTSRVQVAAAKSGPETPRPTVRLRREEGTPTSAPAAIAAPAPAPAPVVALKPSGAEVGLAIAAMVISVVTFIYLASVAQG